MNQNSTNFPSTISRAKSLLKMAGKYKIVMVRHGESEWNQQNLFCGWFDAALSDKGKAEALAAGKAVKVSVQSFPISF